jgi:hypothetical protein
MGVGLADFGLAFGGWNFLLRVGCFSVAQIAQL